MTLAAWARTRPSDAEFDAEPSAHPYALRAHVILEKPKLVLTMRFVNELQRYASTGPIAEQLAAVARTPTSAPVEEQRAVHQQRAARAPPLAANASRVAEADPPAAATAARPSPLPLLRVVLRSPAVIVPRHSHSPEILRFVIDEVAIANGLDRAERSAPEPPVRQDNPAESIGAPDLPAPPSPDESRPSRSPFGMLDRRKTGADSPGCDPFQGVASTSELTAIELEKSAGTTLLSETAPHGGPLEACGEALGRWGVGADDETTLGLRTVAVGISGLAVTSDVAIGATVAKPTGVNPGARASRRAETVRHSLVAQIDVRVDAELGAGKEGEALETRAQVAISPVRVCCSQEQLKLLASLPALYKSSLYNLYKYELVQACTNLTRLERVRNSQLSAR